MPNKGVSLEREGEKEPPIQHQPKECPLVQSSRVVQSQPHPQPQATNNAFFQTGVTSTSVCFHREVTLANGPFRPSLAPSSVSFQPTMASLSTVPFRPTTASSSSVPFRPGVTSASVPLRPAVTSTRVLFQPGAPSTNVPFQPGMTSPVSVVAERQAANFQIADGAQPRYPVRPKPSPGVFVFGSCHSLMAEYLVAMDAGIS